ncbi:type II toxin-antitoxin system PemK/MazF family toxin [Paenibacillus lutrae]|uniref:type II toxin-antitoxin system PemK/MazF family toxin n=1 Tax=Paenibacillus lutrae TaxID=2078573 RepID=UPI0012FCB324|nr:type II toxin-antitoxin system PemK/MazF family toxin [Paenibacillus lutrae]
MSSFRKQEWNQGRSFKRGEVYFVKLPPEPQIGNETSKVMHGDHRVVVLYDSTYPRKTVTVVPITSLNNKLGQPKQTLPNDLKLFKTDYNNAGTPFKGTIMNDSLIKPEQIRTISRDYLERHVGEMLPEDMTQLDLRLISVLSLENTIQKLIERRVEELSRINDKDSAREMD